MAVQEQLRISPLSLYSGRGRVPADLSAGALGWGSSAPLFLQASLGGRFTPVKLGGDQNVAPHRALSRLQTLSADWRQGNPISHSGLPRKDEPRRSKAGEVARRNINSISRNSPTEYPFAHVRSEYPHGSPGSGVPTTRRNTLCTGFDPGGHTSLTATFAIDPVPVSNDNTQPSPWPFRAAPVSPHRRRARLPARIRTGDRKSIPNCDESSPRRSCVRPRRRIKLLRGVQQN